MSKAQHETDPQGTLVCPACKQPVGLTITKRHKTLGVVVPVWGPGPCHNADCAQHAERPEHTQHRH